LPHDCNRAAARGFLALTCGRQVSNAFLKENLVLIGLKNPYSTKGGPDITLPLVPIAIGSKQGGGVNRILVLTDI